MKPKNLRPLLSLAGGRRFIILSTVYSCVSAALIIANAYALSKTIIGLIERDSEIFPLVLTVGAIWLCKAILSSQFERWSLNQAAAFKRSLRAEITGSTEILNYCSGTELSTLLIKGANSLDTYIGRFIPQVIGASILPLLVIATIFFCDPLSAVIAILTLPLIPIFGALIGMYTNDAVARKWASLSTLSSYFEDSLKGIYTLTIFGRISQQGVRIREMGARYTRETMKVLRISFISALVLELSATISVALIAVSVGLRLVNGSMEFLPALIVLILAPEVYFPVRNAASLFHASSDGVEALQKISDKKSLYPRAQWGAKELKTITNLRWNEFHSPFSTGQIPSAKLEPGNLAIIRGGSGLGKTTFLYNLLGLRRDVEISINEVSIVNYTKASYLKEIAWVPQSPTLISGSVRDQFSLVVPSISDEEICQLLEKVNLLPADLSEGLDSVIGGTTEKSAKISGGQIRRIALARALCKKPQILIADEPTADLDAMSARIVAKVLRAVADSGVIVILVTHDNPEQFQADYIIDVVER